VKSSKNDILGAWILWKYRNACVFDKSAPNLQSALQAFKDELHLWQVAGAKGLLISVLAEGFSNVQFFLRFGQVLQFLFL